MPKIRALIAALDSMNLYVIHSVFGCIRAHAEYGSAGEESRMTRVELVARALAASRTGRADAWSECRADALLIIEACAAQPRRLDSNTAFASAPAANDR
jgi:hypothetical protein